MRWAVAGLGTAGCMMLPAILRHPHARLTAAEAHDRQLVVGHSHSFEPAIRKMREIVQSGALGRVRMLHNWCFTDWLYRPRNTEELDTRLGGGVTFRQGSHQFDILRFIGGGLLRSVRAMTARGDAQRPTEDAPVAYMEFEHVTPATAVDCGPDPF